MNIEMVELMLALLLDDLKSLEKVGKLNDDLYDTNLTIGSLLVVLSKSGEWYVSKEHKLFVIGGSDISKIKEGLNDPFFKACLYHELVHVTQFDRIPEGYEHTELETMSEIIKCPFEFEAVLEECLFCQKNGFLDEVYMEEAMEELLTNDSFREAFTKRMVV